MNKNYQKKIIANFIFIIIFLVLFLILGLYIFFQDKKNTNNQMKLITVATALPGVQSFLEGPVKNHLQKENINLKVKFLSNGYEQTNILVKTDQALAKLDSHMPYTYLLSNIQSIPEEEKLQIAQAFYWAEIGIYNTKNNPNKITNWDELNAKLQQKDSQKPLKILICSSQPQQNLALLFLEKSSLIKRKTEKKDEKLLTLQEKLNLQVKDFIIPQNISIHLVDQLTEVFNRFRNENEYDLFINYPALVGEKALKNEINILKKLTWPKENTQLAIYTISLITKKKNVDSDAIKVLKNILKKPELISEYQQKYGKNLQMIPANEIDDITQKINQYFVSA